MKGLGELLQHCGNLKKKCRSAPMGAIRNMGGTTFVEQYHQQINPGNTFNFDSIEEAGGLPKGVAS